MARNHGKQLCGIWATHDGQLFKVPSMPTLKFKLAGHAALRAFVYRRDDFTCQKCGWRPADEEIPQNYNGRYAVYGCRPNPSPKNKRRRERPEILCGLDLDHKWPRALGGVSHPSNLQTMCGPCNSGKCDRIEGLNV